MYVLNEKRGCRREASVEASRFSASSNTSEYDFDSVTLEHVRSIHSFEGAKILARLLRLKQISMRLLTRMLKERSVQELLRPAKRFGRRDRGTWTYVIEEAFFDPLLLSLVKKRRREQRNAAQMAM